MCRVFVSCICVCMLMCHVCVSCVGVLCVCVCLLILRRSTCTLPRRRLGEHSSRRSRAPLWPPPPPASRCDSHIYTHTHTYAHTRTCATHRRTHIRTHDTDTPHRHTCITHSEDTASSNKHMHTARHTHKHIVFTIVSYASWFVCVLCVLGVCVCVCVLTLGRIASSDLAQIFFSGGYYDGSFFSNTVDVFDMNTNTWRVENMTSARAGAS